MVSHQSGIHVQAERAGMTVLWMSGRRQMGPVQNRICNRRPTACVIKMGFVFRTMRPMNSSVVKLMLLVKTENVAVFVFHGIMKTSRVETATRGRRPKKTGHHLRSAVIRPDSALTSIKTWPVVK